MTNETTKSITPIGDDVEYGIVALTDDQMNENNPAKSGIVLDGVTVRIDNITFTGDDEGDEPEMLVDYTIVAGELEVELAEFEPRLMKVAIHCVNEYAQRGVDEAEARELG